MLRYLIIALLAASPAIAGCPQIKNQDQRQFCRAVEKDRKSSCAQIKNHDQRQFCRGVTR